MKAPLNRRVFVIGYGAATPLGRTFPETWERAVRGEAGFRKVTRCQVESVCDVVGEIPDWDPEALEFVDAKEAYNWNAAFVILTMAVCQRGPGPRPPADGRRDRPPDGLPDRFGDQRRRRLPDGDAQFPGAGPAEDQPLSPAQPLRQSPVGEGGDAARVHGTGLFPPGGLRLGQPRHRHRRPHDPRRGLRFRPGRGGRYPDPPRDHPRVRQHERHDQGPPGGSGVRRPGQGLPSLQQSTGAGSSFPKGRASSSWRPRRCSAATGSRRGPR